MFDRSSHSLFRLFSPYIIHALVSLLQIISLIISHCNLFSHYEHPFRTPHLIKPITTAGIPPLRYVANDSVKLYLLKLMTPQFTEKGHYLVKEGQMADRIIFLVDGGAVVCRVPVLNGLGSSSPRKTQKSPSKSKRSGSDSSSVISRHSRLMRGSFEGRTDDMDPRPTRLEAIHEGGANVSTRSDYGGIEGNNIHPFIDRAHPLVDRVMRNLCQYARTICFNTCTITLSILEILFFHKTITSSHNHHLNITIRSQWSVWKEQAVDRNKTMVPPPQAHTIPSPAKA